LRENQPDESVVALQGKQAYRSRYTAEDGRAFEGRVERILGEMKKSGRIFHFTRSPRNSEEDSKGIDFVVYLDRDGEVMSQSFGVTISKRCRRRAQMKHPGVPQLQFPPGIGAGVIKRAVLALFPKRQK
jgi:hypothetical protein